MDIIGCLYNKLNKLNSIEKVGVRAFQYVPPTPTYIVCLAFHAKMTLDAASDGGASSRVVFPESEIRCDAKCDALLLTGPSRRYLICIAGYPFHYSRPMNFV